MKLRKTIIAVLILVAQASGCATSNKNSSNAWVAPESGADKLDSVETQSFDADESANAAIFADISEENNSNTIKAENQKPAVDGALASSLDTGGGDGMLAASAVEANGNFFYKPVGGEKLGRVAYMIYGDRKMVSELQALNPEINRNSGLQPEQLVYFDPAKINPQTNYLTKDLLERYSQELSASLSKVNAPREATNVAKGETLQAVSQRLYGTTRYWTELYLLNKEKVAGFDKVKAGMEISYIRHDQISQVAAAPNNQSTAPSASEQIPEEATLANNNSNGSVDSQMTNQLQPAIEPSGGEVTANPTSTNDPVALQAPAAALNLPKAQEPVKQSFWTAANIRKAVYIALVAAVIGIAFIMTRGGNKKYSGSNEEQRKVI